MGFSSDVALQLVLDIASKVLSFDNDTTAVSHRNYFGDSITITINDHSITIRSNDKKPTPAKGPGDTVPNRRAGAPHHNR